MDKCCDVLGYAAWQEHAEAETSQTLIDQLP